MNPIATTSLHTLIETAIKITAIAIIAAFIRLHDAITATGFRARIGTAIIVDIVAIIAGF